MYRLSGSGLFLLFLILVNRIMFCALDLVWCQACQVLSVGGGFQILSLILLVVCREYCALQGLKLLLIISWSLI